MSDTAFGLALLEIIWINILLSGDNAVVIALASRSLPPGMQKWGIILGTVPAVVLRIGFTCAVSWLIVVPFLKIVGGVLLVWIAFGLLRPEDKLAATRHRLVCTIWTAARTIIVADAIMSLDNVVAIAAAAHGDVRLVMIGLLLSMPLVIFGAGLLIRLLNRFPILVVAGASLLGYIAGDLIVSDRWMIAWLGGADTPVAIGCPLAVAAALAVTGLALRWSTLQSAFVPSRGDAL